MDTEAQTIISKKVPWIKLRESFLAVFISKVFLAQLQQQLHLKSFINEPMTMKTIWMKARIKILPIPSTKLIES